MSAIPFEINNSTLRINSSELGDIDVNFKWPISEVLAFENSLVVRTRPDKGACDNQNVFAVNSRGEVVWVVKDRKYVYDSSPYMKILKEGGMLKLFNWDGLDVLVDPESWKEISAEYGR